MGHNAAGRLADPLEQLRAFIRDGRIATAPAKRTRRLLLLDQVARRHRRLAPAVSAV